MADTLHELGFKGLRATGLRRKHVVALVREWKRQGRSIGTMKNRMAHIRWWANRIDRPAVVPSNGALGIGNREYMTNKDRSVVLDPDKLALVRDAHVAMALRLEVSGQTTLGRHQSGIEILDETVLLSRSIRSGFAALTRREPESTSRACGIRYKGGRAGREAVEPLVCVHPSRSLARAVIGVLTLAARPVPRPRMQE